MSAPERCSAVQLKILRVTEEKPLHRKTTSETQRFLFTHVLQRKTLNQHITWLVLPKGSLESY